MGVHKGYANKLNFGTLIKIPIEEFNELQKIAQTNSRSSFQQIAPQGQEIPQYKNSERKNESSEPIIKKNQIEAGNFYVSNIYY